VVSLNKSVNVRLKQQEEHSLNQDSAIYWRRDGSTCVVNDVQLTGDFKLRANDPFWKEVY
jgi:hypothetical protein